MGNVRGTDLGDALAFVAETYDREALPGIIATLPPEAKGIFEKTIRDHSWYPLSALDAFLTAARATLDPASNDFFRRQGRFAATQRKAGPLLSMVATPYVRMRLAPTVFRIFYDVGRLEVIGSDPDSAHARIHDFPATEVLCERFLGIWEGMRDASEGPGCAVETACRRRGDPYCELQVLAEAPSDPTPP